MTEDFPTRAADEEVELEGVVQACEPEDDYESADGVSLFFERLAADWYVGPDGRLKPPRKTMTLDRLNLRHIDGDGAP
jgi:hypothetical protein